MPSRQVLARERGIAAIAALVALAGWVVVVLDDAESAVGAGLALWCGAFAVAVLLATLNRVASTHSWARVAEAVTSVRRTDPLVEQGRSFGLPGPWIWLAPLLPALPMLVWLPFTPEAAGGDWSIGFGAMFFVLLAGPFGLLAGIILWLLLGLPSIGLAVAFGGRGDHAARVGAVGIAGLLWSIVAFSVTLVLGAPDLDSDSTRAAQGRQTLALLGLDDAIVVHPVLLWIARGCVLLIVASIVLTLRGARLRRSRSIPPL